MKNNNNSGIFFGTKPGVLSAILRLFKRNRYVIKSIDNEGHLAIIGGTGSGKSRCIVKPTLYHTWNKPFVAVDIKGDLHQGYKQLENHRRTKVFSLRGGAGYSYDPLEFIRTDGEENLVSNVQELVNSLIPLPIGTKDSFWIDSARNLLTAAMLYHLDTFGDEVNFIDIALRIMLTPPIELIKEISFGKNEAAKIFINNFIGVKNLDESNMFTGIAQELTNALSIFASDTRVRKALTPSKKSIKWSEDTEKCSIFISVPEDMLEQYSRILTMMFTQLIRTLERRPEKHSLEGINKPPVLLMLDEFPRLGKVDVIASALSTLRSKNVTICLVMQSLAQLDAIYGEKVRRIILDNCVYKAILNAADLDSQKYFSELIGTVKSKKTSRSTSYDLDKQKTGYSDQTFEVEEPQIRPHEFATLKDIALITPNGFQCVKKIPYHEDINQQHQKKSTGNFCSFATKAWGKIHNFFKKIVQNFVNRRKNSSEGSVCNVKS